jgi:hypothetical protein
MNFLPSSLQKKTIVLINARSSYVSHERKKKFFFNVFKCKKKKKLNLF